ncbi:MAG: 30S ribosomal protein S20 [Gemmataceae bacterium]|nr:30S ribosomal protein S20 [Gemmataceae bacterium]
MPHTHTAKKRGRQAAKRRLRNRAVKKAIRIQIKNVVQAAKASPDKLQAEVVAAIKKLDKAAAKRVIHPNTAARRKSQLARLANAKSAPAPSPTAPTA